MRVHPICSCRRSFAFWKKNTIKLIVSNLARKPARLSRYLVLTLGSFVFTSLPSLAQTSAHYRPDLAAILTQHFCHQKIDSSHPSKLWQYEIYDFDLLTYHVQAKSGESLNSRQMQRAAFHLAARNRHAGYAFAVCSKTSAWMATTPNAKKPFDRSTEALHVSLSHLKSKCKTLTIDHASDQSSKVRRIMQENLPDLKTKHLQINHHLLTSGFLSLSCQPLQDELGPLTLAMFPIQYQFQDQENLPKSVPDFFSWINQKRQESGLPTIASSQAVLHQAAASLARHNESVHHFRPHLKKIQDHLQTQQIRLLGENRVRARNPELLSWLLWSSPRHRSLLLNRKATHIGLHMQQHGDEQLLVILLGEHQPQAGPSAPLARSKRGEGSKL